MFAARRRFLGLRRRDGTTGSRAWETLALDLDGEATTADKARAFVGVCRSTTKASSSIDGARGVDDALATIVQALAVHRPDVESASDLATRDGVSTWVLVLDDVGGGDDAGAPGHLYVAGAPAARPTFGPSDRWRLGPGVDFPDGYVAGGTWVSGPPREVVVPVDVFGPPVPWVVDSVVTVSLATGEGVLVGAAPVGPLRTAMTSSLASLGICPSDPAFASVLGAVDAAPDLVFGAPRLQRTDATCDAVSVAIGFELVSTGEPSGTGWLPPAVPACK